MATIWDKDFGYVKKSKIGAIMIGEWGGWMKSSNKDDVWQNTLAEYISKNDIDFFYWCVNPNSGDTGGILNDDWITPVKPKLELLVKACPNPSTFLFEGKPTPPTPPPSPEPTPTPKPPKPSPTPKPPKPTPVPTPSNTIQITMKIDNSWTENGKVCEQYSVDVKNISSSTQRPKFNITGQINKIWNVTGTKSPYSLPEWFPNGLDTGASFNFGFVSCGNIKVSVV
jgi:endoglucanase